MIEEETSKFLSVEVEGKDKALWGKLQPKLIEAIGRFLDTVIDHENNSTIRDEAKKFTTALLDYGKQKLYKAGLDNDKIIAEVELLYSQKERELAEARRIHAESDAIELENNARRLKLALGGMKVLMIGKQGEEELLFLKQVDGFISLLNSLDSKESRLE